MVHVESDAAKAQFLKGMLLGWVPLLVFIIPGLIIALRGISSERATGVGAVSGGFAEGFAVFGFAAFVVCEVVAIFLLARTLSKKHKLRSFVSVVSMFCSALVLAAIALVLGLLITHSR